MDKQLNDLLETEGKNLDVDIENGTKDGASILIVPHENLAILVQAMIRQYLQRQNPALNSSLQYNEANHGLERRLKMLMFSATAILALVSATTTKQHHYNTTTILTSA